MRVHSQFNAHTRPHDGRPMVLILFIGLLLCVIPCAVVTAQSVTIDSLRRELRVARHDTTRVLLLASLAEAVGRKDTQRALDHAREAVALARRHGASRIQASAIVSLAFVQIVLRRHEDARKTLAAGQRVIDASGDARTQRRALRCLGLIERNLTRPDRALALFERTLSDAERLGDSSAIGVALMDLAEVHRFNGKQQVALDYCLRSRPFVERHGSPSSRISIMRLLGELYGTLGKSADAIAVLQAGVHRAEELRDTMWIATVLTSLGDQYEDDGNKPQAINCYTRVLEIGERYQDHSTIAGACSRLGQMHRTKGEFSEAVRYYTRSLASATALSDTRRITIAESDLGTVRMQQGEYEAALEVFTRALTRFREEDDRPLAKYIHSRIGMTYGHLGDPARALESHRRCLVLSEALGKPGDIARDLVNVGMAQLSLGQHTDALASAQRAFEYAERASQPRTLVRALQLTGDIHAARGSYGQASEYYRRCIDVYRPLGNSAELARTHVSLGNMHTFLHEHVRARESYRSALDLMRGSEDRFTLGRIIAAIGHTYFRERRWEDALPWHQKALALADSLRDRRSIATQLTAIAHIHIMRGSPDSAVSCASRALAIAEDMRTLEDITRAAVTLSQALEAQKEYTQALTTLRRAAELKDTLVNQENIRVVNEMEARYAAAERERTIAQLEAGKRAQLLELAERERELTLRTLQSLQHKSRAELLTRDQERTALELKQRNTQLVLSRKELALQRALRERTARDKDLQAAIASQATSLRNASLAGIVLILTVGVLGVKRIQSRRVEATLRAESAEYRARSAETQTLSLQIEHERRRRLAQQEYTRQLIDTQERERSRIAGALHDSLGQDLLVIKSRTLLALQDAALAPEARAEFMQIEAMATAALQDVRRISHDLRPYQLDRLGLTKTLRATVQQLSGHAGITFEERIDDIDGLLSKDDETNVFRIVQESLNNVLKHSGATHALVRLSHSDTHITLEVSDNGRGLNGTPSNGNGSNGSVSAGQVTQGQPTNGHAANGLSGFGMQNMRERAEMLGGTLHAGSDPAGGTRLTITLPVGRTAPAHA